MNETIETNARNNVRNDNVANICHVSSNDKEIFSTTIERLQKVTLKIASKDLPSSPSQQQDIKNKMKKEKCHCGIATLVSSSSLIGSLHKKSYPRRSCDIINKTSDHCPKSCGSSVTFRNKCDHPSIRSAMERSKKVSTTARKVDQSPFFPNRRRSGSF